MTTRRLSSSTTLELESEPSGNFIVDGVNCRVRVGKKATVSGDILIHPEVVDATVEIGDGCTIDGVIRVVRGKGATIRIGEKTTINQAAISLHETASVTVGRDCMFSTEVRMDPSDMHPIFDRATGERLNPPQDIEIGDHVWLSTRVLVLKGARIGSGSIVGAGSIVAGVVPENTLVVGSPAKVVRENVVWTRDMDQKAVLVPGSSPAQAAKPRRRWWSGRTVP